MASRWGQDRSGAQTRKGFRLRAARLVEIGGSIVLS